MEDLDFAKICEKQKSVKNSNSFKRPKIRHLRRRRKSLRFCENVIFIFARLKHA